MQRGVANKARTIRIPVHIVEREQRISRAERELVATLERAPTDQELARAGEAAAEAGARGARGGARGRVARQARRRGRLASFGELFASNEAPPDEQVEVELTERALHRGGRGAPEREQQILRLRYGLGGAAEPKSLEEIGRILGITRERVRQLEARGAAPARRAARDRRATGAA